MQNAYAKPVFELKHGSILHTWYQSVFEQDRQAEKRSAQHHLTHPRDP